MAEGRRVTVALWVVQGLLALVFLFAGGSKLVMSIEEMTKESRCRARSCGSSASPRWRARWG